MFNFLYSTIGEKAVRPALPRDEKDKIEAPRKKFMKSVPQRALSALTLSDLRRCFALWFYGNQKKHACPTLPFQSFRSVFMAKT